MREIYSHRKFFLFFLTALLIILACATPARAATTQLHIVKYANDGTTILAEKTLSYQEMESSLPVEGDGITHYYLQGPVFIDNPDPATQEYLRWNPGEDTNAFPEKDVGAVKGTDLKDICNLVGGMAPGETLKIKASDGLSKEFAYKNVYTPPARQGPMVITWYKDGHYPDSGYDEGMRLLFFADASVNPWGEHVFGNFDWHESADQQYWYYYQQGSEHYPTTTGLSVKYVSEILIYSSQSPTSGSGGFGGGTGVRSLAGEAPADDSSRYGYRGSKLTTYASGTLNGSIRLFYDSNSTPFVVSNRIREYSIPLTLPSGINLTIARLYVYISKSHGIQTNQGVIPPLQMEFNHRQLDPEQVYVDTDGDDHRNVSATFAYDVLGYLQGNGSSTISIRNPAFDQSVFSVDDVILLVAYEQDQEPSLQYWIGEGCDVIYSDPKKGLLPRDAVTSIAFSGTLNTTENLDADLIVVTTGLDTVNTTEHAVRFGNRTWYNAFDNLSASPVLRVPVTSCLNVSGNSVSIESSIRKMDADYLVNRNAVLVIKQNQSADTEAESNPASIIPGRSVFVNSTILPAPTLPVTNLTSRQTIPVNSSFPPSTIPIANTTQTCNLSIHSDPEGALIFVDGTYLGKTTPYMLRVNPGDEHRIRVELDGFLPAERVLTLNNDTTVCEHLYSDVYSTKGRSDTLVQERDMTHNGGLYINSRPSPATISLNGIQMPLRTPAIIYGLKEGTYMVQLSLEQGDSFLKGTSDIQFADQVVYVHPFGIVPVDVAANSSPLRDIIIDSRDLRGEPFTVNGHAIQKTIPDMITTPTFDSYITVFHNWSYISYTLPGILNEDQYLAILPRQHYNLDVFVDSKPGGAEVFIDGFRTGLSTPYSFANISDGPHRIMVSKTGYIPQESIITLLYTPVPIPTTNVTFKLDEYPNGFLSVASDPSGAEIGLDGMDTGEITPFIFFALPTGSHSITIGNKTMTRKYPDVTVNALEAVNLSVYLEEIQE